MTQRILLGVLSGWVLLAVGVVQAQVPAKSPAFPGPDDWPWWRGPTRNGVAPPGPPPPLKWSATANVLWKAPLPGRGHGSPTVVGDRIYLATADETKRIQSVLGLDRASGKILWVRDLHQGEIDKRANKRSSNASSTVACDGRRLFVNFKWKGSVHTSALDLNGKVLWQKEITPYVTHQGFGTSPAIYGRAVLVNADNKGGGRFVALDRETGAILWQHQRPALPNYASPIILRAAGKEQLFLTGCDMVSSFDPHTGKKLWEVKGATTECVTSTVTDGRVIITSGGYPDNHIAAVLADGSGKEIWRQRTRVYVPSMVLFEKHLYSVGDDGVAQCTRLADGEVLWKERLGGTFNSSLVLVGDRIYGFDQEGQGFVFKATPEKLDLLAQNRLGDDVFATPAICNGRLYHRVGEMQDGRRREYLYCLGAKKGE